jgi:hypothetical protein
MNINEHLRLLGTRQRDVVTGLTGVVVSICFDINGCIMGALKPPIDKDGKLQAAEWIDLQRLKVSGEPVCEPFNFIEPPRLAIAGTAEKPAK